MASYDQNLESISQEDEQIQSAARNGQADDLARLLECRTLSPGELQWLALLATESMSLPTLQVLLDNGWDINTPESYLEPPFLG